MVKTTFVMRRAIRHEPLDYAAHKQVCLLRSSGEMRFVREKRDMRSNVKNGAPYSGTASVLQIENVY